jgi:DNA-binding response OmpR family regulator
MKDEPAKILVLDDDPDIALMIRMMLEYKGYKVNTANSLQIAKDFLRTETASLIIMDMLLSGSNGIDVCRELKSDPSFAHIPVIMISAHPNASSVCIEAGADDFVSKPFQMNDLLERVANQLQKS